MRLRRLHLLAFGPFTNRQLDFGDAHGLTLVYGRNEAGKSSALRAITDLRFGIPARSADDFLHPYAQLRLGGEFVDRHGRLHLLLRRKGKNATLLSAADAGFSDAATPVPPDIEALLNCGLNREEHDAMFGLDHERLRAGGAALLRGEGDIGAALFEASAGVRSVPRVLERLDEQARKLFVPRGKTGRVNQALAAHDESHAAFKAAQVRPLEWARLLGLRDEAAAKLAGVEREHADINARLALVRELRAVAPLMAALDHAQRRQAETADAVLLASGAPNERAAAASALADALHHAAAAQVGIDALSTRLAELQTDAPVIAVAERIRRLATQSEAIDRHRHDAAQAAASVAQARRRLVEIAHAIAPVQPVEAVLAALPPRVARARTEGLLRKVEQAQGRLEQQRESLRQQREPLPVGGADLPEPQARTTLRIARAAAAQHEGEMARLAQLPAEAKNARRRLDALLSALGLSNEAALQRVRPVLAAQIDAVLKQQSKLDADRTTARLRIEQASAALEDEQARLDQLLAAGAVPTRSDVEAARTRRDRGWALVQARYIEQRGTTAEFDWSDAQPLPKAYADAVVEADRLIDRLAADTERAAQLQSRRQSMGRLHAERELQQQQLDQHERDAARLEAEWQATLAAGHLPPLAPAAVREWQSNLQLARAALESVEALDDELARHLHTQRRLCADLRDALVAVGQEAPQPQAPLASLLALADEAGAAIEQRIEAGKMAQAAAAERAQQHALAQSRQAQLAAALDAALAELAPELARLLLGSEADTACVHARLDEFDELRAAATRLDEAQTLLERARNALALLDADAHSVAVALGEPTAPADVRAFVDAQAKRLSVAEAAQRERDRLEQAIASAREHQRQHEATALRHQATLDALCRRAGVSSIDGLPQAEERSSRQREARQAQETTLAQLAQASRRSVDELRALLAQHDPASLDADEAALAHELERGAARLKQARDEDENARRQLDAIDSSDEAAVAREAMEQAAASVRADMEPWIRTKLAQALLDTALKRFRERAQGPMLKAASTHFARMTRGEFVRLAGDDSTERPLLLAERRTGAKVAAPQMSEGTRDQLYLALRLAALDIRREAGIDLPLVLDDVLMTSDDERSAAVLEALAEFGRAGQVIVFTHHRHIAELARQQVPAELLRLAEL